MGVGVRMRWLNARVVEQRQDGATTIPQCGNGFRCDNQTVQRLPGAASTEKRFARYSFMPQEHQPQNWTGSEGQQPFPRVRDTKSH